MTPLQIVVAVLFGVVLVIFAGIVGADMYATALDHEARKLRREIVDLKAEIAYYRSHHDACEGAPPPQPVAAGEDVA